LQLLRVGRHFRLKSGCKIIVGRNKEENETLLKMAADKGPFLRVLGYGSPVTLVRGSREDEAIMTAATICARYSDAKNLSAVDVKVMSGNQELILNVPPADGRIIEDLKIEKMAGNRLLLKR
jgi:predicted ribosome quality control (RQC) complex YloA/Tae2 family protein